MNRSCCLLLPTVFLLYSPVAAQVTASFTVPATVCAGTPLTVNNTSVGATNYYWSFCAADFSANPDAVNLGNPNGVVNNPVFGCYVQDADGNFYGLVTCYAEGHLIRLRFGNSLLNNPTAEDLGTFGGVIPEQLEGIQLLKVNGNWTAIMVGGGNQSANSSPRVVKVDFGNALTNPGTATNWGNVGGLNLPHKLYIGFEGGNYYGFTTNVIDNTITRLSFGPDFTNLPTGINMGNIGNLDYPCGLTFVKYAGNWYCLTANMNSNSLTRLDFGTSLLNTPTGVNIGNPGGVLNTPRDIVLFTTCSGVYGFVTGMNNNDLVKLYFGNDPTTVPGATDLGNIGNFSFPHSLSDLFRVGNDIYTFVPNANSNSLTRLRFAGCSDIPGSSAQNPAPVTYPNPGVYDINLMVDLGLPTQTSYCQQVYVAPLPQGTLIGDTVCTGDSPSISFNTFNNTTQGAAPFTISYTDGTHTYTQGGLPGVYQSLITVPALGTYTLTNITGSNGCSTDTTETVNVSMKPLPQGGIAGIANCGSDSATLWFTASSGTGPFFLQLSPGGTAFLDPGQTLTLPLSQQTTFNLLWVVDKYCERRSGFDTPSVTLTPRPNPVVQFNSPGSICYNAAPELLTAASETTGLPGSGAYSGPGTDAAGNFTPADAGVGTHTILYSYTANDGCTAADSNQIVVNPAPVQAEVMITGCEGVPIQVSAAKGGATYTWTPATGLSNATVANPTAELDGSITYVAQVIDSDGCAASDTVAIKDAGPVKRAFMIPNGFTPNGDGHNDCFGIHTWGQVTLDEFDIFDRWGTKVFSTKDPADCWDGTVGGQPEPPGAYVFVIRAETACGKITRTGTLMLMR
ncbi:gliding motility-associated C-terminal domain-containing protein [Dinghuibacter silviterrae]|uniref:Gliding motility-associated-like protein n=1 Tax=Dinghuibacter silviterrae TaxID=1539049 RepID=A0A4V3GKN9_9BACT|nr:gliding motility-associated C-terminal domain-containing protein [Dinghuibacter silviterrae]TDW96392.1 gliding motility-associated-like protein [Dinghuibacter silviterrae]